MINRLIPTAALIIALVIIIGYVAPTFSGEIAETRAAIARTQTALLAAERFGEKENELASAKNAISPSDLARLDTLLPGSVDNVGVILDLTALAARTGVQLASINAVTSSADTAGENTQSTVGSIDLHISAAGSYQAFRTFLASIEHSARLLDMVTLTVNGSDTGVYSYDMVVRLYWLRS